MADCVQGQRAQLGAAAQAAAGEAVPAAGEAAADAAQTCQPADWQRGRLHLLHAAAAPSTAPLTGQCCPTVIFYFKNCILNAPCPNMAFSFLIRHP